jgi:hypothetical protein
LYPYGAQLSRFGKNIQKLYNIFMTRSGEKFEQLQLFVPEEYLFKHKNYRPSELHINRFPDNPNNLKPESAIPSTAISPIKVALNGLEAVLNERIENRRVSRPDITDSYEDITAAVDEARELEGEKHMLSQVREILGIDE